MIPILPPLPLPPTGRDNAIIAAAYLCGFGLGLLGIAVWGLYRLLRRFRRSSRRPAVVIQFPSIEVEDPVARMLRRVERWEWCKACGQIVVAGECDHTRPALNAQP